MTNDSKSVAKSFSIKTANLLAVEKLSDKYGMCDSEIVQMAIEILENIDEKNLTLHVMKMVMDRKTKCEKDV
jgi:hypothetical protein